MTDADLLLECKKGLNIPVASVVFDGALMQKLAAVKSFMMGAGVSAESLRDPLAVGAIVLGVTDLWSLTGGEIKFSPAFNTIVGQLAMRS